MQSLSGRTLITYDALGRAVQRSRPYFAGGTAQWTTIRYDAIGRVNRKSRPNGSRTDIHYDGLEDGKVRQRITVTPSTGTARTTTREKDALGRLVKVIDPLNNSNQLHLRRAGESPHHHGRVRAT